VTGRQWCGVVRFAWSCPVLFDRPPPRRRVFSLSEMAGPKSKTTLAWTSASSTGGPGPVSLRPQAWCEHLLAHVACTWLAAAWPQTEPPGSGSSHVLNATQAEPFWLVFRAPKASRIRDKKARTRCLDRLAEWSFWNPSGSEQRDPNTLAPNRIKARTTPSRPSRISTSS